MPCRCFASGGCADQGAGVLGDRLVVRVAEIPHLSKILGGESGVHGPVETILGEIPTAATRHPGRSGEPSLDALVVTALDLFAHIEITQVAVQDRGDTA